MPAQPPPTSSLRRFDSVRVVLPRTVLDMSRRQPPTARMIAVSVAWLDGRPPLLVRATVDLDETHRAIHTALGDQHQPFRLLTQLEGVEVEPSAGVWPMLFGQDSALPLFKVVPVHPAVAPSSAAPSTVTQQPREFPHLGEHVVVVDLVHRVYPIGPCARCPLAHSIRDSYELHG